MSLFLVWLALAVVIGYLGSVNMRSEPERGVVLSTAAGILGALLAEWLLEPLFAGPPDRGYFSVTAVAVSLLGAVVLVGLANYLRLGRVR
ncbi:MAG TPA: GlsB/YeaQ/YmgE family stress response membrane protein [Steroidobacteraceae bacterium]|nr:GlsB/YeaQ/YmgE family stress response membrane protein [Steroidobacteraceae bacterium]